MMSKTSTKTIETAIIQSNTKYHIRATGKGLTFRVNENFLGWLGLNVARAKGQFELNPVIGIISEEIERLLVVLSECHDKTTLYPTMSVSIGYLMPEKSYRAWIFGSDDDAPQIRSVIEAIENYAIPFIERYSTKDGITEILLNGKFSDQYYSMYRNPIALLIRGDKDLAVDSIKKSDELVATYSGPVVADYQKFRHNFIEFVNSKHFSS